MTHLRQELRTKFALPATGQDPPVPWTPPISLTSPPPARPIEVSEGSVPLFKHRVGRRVLRFTPTEVSYGTQCMAFDSIDEVSYFHEPMFGWPVSVLLLLVLPLGLLAFSPHRGRYRLRLRAGRNSIDVTIRQRSRRSGCQQQVEEQWAALVDIVGRIVSPIVADRLVDRMIAGTVVRVGGMRFDANGVGTSRMRRLAWEEVGAADSDGHYVHINGFDRRGRLRSAGRIGARRPNAGLVPMLTQLGRARVCQFAGAAPEVSGAIVFGPATTGITHEWHGLRSVAVVLTVALAGTAVVARIHFDATRDPAAGKPAWATAWDPRVASIASFVEHARGLTFRHPVAVVFLPEAEFVTWLTAERGEAGSTSGVATNAPVGVGSAPASPTATDLTTSLVVGAYFPADRTVRIRGLELTPDARVTLAHELTHALQDQVFDLASLQQHANDGESAAGLTAVLEGDAVTVERAYYDSLTREEQFAVSTSETGDGALSAQSSDARLAGVYLPYVFGPQLIATVAAVGGVAARDRALHDPPSSDLGVLDPALFLAGHDAPAKVATPVPPHDAEPAGGADTHGTMGALNWYLTLSSRVDSRLVARTIGEWDGDSYAAYRRGQVTCVDAVVHVRPMNGADHLADVFSRWAWGNAPTISFTGNDIRITTCEPLATGSTGEGVNASLRVIYARNQLVLDGIAAGFKAPLAHCIADRALTELSVETLSASPLVLPGDWADRLELYHTVCAG